jgi:hypothetical protein
MAPVESIARLGRPAALMMRGTVDRVNGRRLEVGGQSLQARRAWRLLATLLAVVGCTRNRGGIERPDGDAAQPFDGQMLLTPVGEPAALLGRVVTQDAGGLWVVSDERAPGCEVTERRVTAKWKHTFVDEADRVASISIGNRQLAGLSAEYGEGLRQRMVIENEAELRADLRGSCGDNVITMVRVGKGSRELGYYKNASGGAWVPIGKTKVGAGAGAHEKIEGTLAWTEPQAWSFTVGAPNSGTAVDLVVHMPAELAAGTTFTAEIEVKRDVWLVVLYEAADGSVGVLLPSSGAPEQIATAGDRVELVPFTAIAAPGQARTHEKLIVYGFAEKGDFDRFRPPAGAVSPEQAKAYALELPRRLEEIPRRRWTSTTHGYVIEADGAGADRSKETAR